MCARRLDSYGPEVGSPRPQEDPDMTKHPHVETVDRMTEAIFSQDHDTLAAIFTDNFVFHHRSPLHLAGDYKGVGGLLETLGYFFEETGGDIKLDQKYCIAEGDWVTEWEHATLGRNGKTLESDNSFVYRFDGNRIAEMWMFIGALQDAGEAFFA
jgi:ketosteroid isomerase-like protein